MFTGIIERIAKIVRIQPLGKGKKFLIDPGAKLEVSLGESIALDGACFTVVSLEGNNFWVEVSSESLSRTSFDKIQAGDQVNLERSLRLTDRLGGHIVLGHIDGIGAIKRIEQRGEFMEIEIEAPREVAGFLVEKGSIAVDGISLTINALSGQNFSAMLIPETLKRTTLAGKKTGERVNLEADIIGKYVARLLKKDKEAKGLTLEKLIEEGY